MAFREILSIGFDKNGEADFRVSVDKDKAIIELRKELERCRDLRAKLEVQSMQAMDRLRGQIRDLGAEPLL